MSGVRRQVSGVRGQVSGVRCQVSGVTCNFFSLFFFGQSGEASRRRFCYQRCLPRLVCIILDYGQLEKKVESEHQLLLDLYILNTKVI